MGGVDVVLEVEWLQSLGTMDFSFKEIFLKFSCEGKEFELSGSTGKIGNIINYNGMKNIFKK